MDHTDDRFFTILDSSEKDAEASCPYLTALSSPSLSTTVDTPTTNSSVLSAPLQQLPASPVLSQMPAGPSLFLPHRVVAFDAGDLLKSSTPKSMCMGSDGRGGGLRGEKRPAEQSLMGKIIGEASGRLSTHMQFDLTVLVPSTQVQALKTKSQLQIRDHVDGGMQPVVPERVLDAAEGGREGGREGADSAKSD